MKITAKMKYTPTAMRYVNENHEEIREFLPEFWVTQERVAENGELIDDSDKNAHLEPCITITNTDIFVWFMKKGDYVVRFLDGRIDTYTEKDFEAQFEVVL